MKIDVLPHPADSRITLLTLAGRLDSLTEPEAAPRVLGAVKTCDTGIIFDLAGLEFVSSAGLRLLLQACRNCTAGGKRMAMVRAQPAVYKIFKLASFDEAFNLHEDGVSALEAVWNQAE
ncbi:MAG: STAS domain-containing protein [Acidobacteria bacterium]|nr:STAS domain-containing protein [Acidobacteriota bacterium]